MAMAYDGPSVTKFNEEYGATSGEYFSNAETYQPTESAIDRVRFGPSLHEGMRFVAPAMIGHAVRRAYGNIAGAAAAILYLTYQRSMPYSLGPYVHKTRPLMWYTPHLAAATMVQYLI
tara:strand:- start:1235 stop:1588 length:354 start_codon:yes stop_codon:yes gene_type:complete